VRVKQRFPLRGADLVLVGMQSLWGPAEPSHNTVLVVEADGPLEAERIRRALERFLDFCPWPAARLRRPFPWGRLSWIAGAREGLDLPPVTPRAVASPAELHRDLEAELNMSIDPRQQAPIRFLVADRFLVLTWFHPLMDPRGGQNLLAHLTRLDAHGGQPSWNGVTPSFVPVPDPRPLRERGRIARRSLAYMATLAPLAPVSPGSQLTAPAPARFRQESFTDGSSSGKTDMATGETCWRLAVVGKAMAELWQRRRLPDVPFLVAVSVDLRAKGDSEPTFGNALAFHFARFTSSETADVPALARALRHQMADAVRDGQIEANAVAMEFLAYRPRWMMLRKLPWTTGRETFSFNCADIGDFPAPLGRLFGRRVVNAYHAPAVLPRPGLGVFFNRCGDWNNIVISWIEGAASESDAARLIEVIREEMGWTRRA
jgi:hypothetical protein